MTRPREAARRPAMQISDFLSPDRVLVDFRAAGKAALLDDLARRVAPASGVGAEKIAAALAAREGLGSTGVGHGVALPHARIAGLAGFIGLFARLASPIAFEAIDAAPVDLVFLLLIPAEAGSAHLAALAAISRRLREDGVAARLRAARGPAEAHAVLTGAGEAPRGR